MIQFINDAFQKTTLDNIIDQDGKVVTQQTIQNDKINEMRKYLYKKRSEFEAALAVKCNKEDVRLQVQPHPQLGNLYIIGPEVFALQVDADGVKGVRVQ